MIQDLSQTIESLVMDIQEGKLLLPELQRSYVWKASQVRDLFDSLYHGYIARNIWYCLIRGKMNVLLEPMRCQAESPLGKSRLSSGASV
jgi:hypothetical protein